MRERVARTASKNSPPRPRRRAWYQRTAALNSSAAGSLCESSGSPTEDLFFDPTLDVFPGLQLHGPGLDRGDASFDFNFPRRFGIGVGRTIQARQQFRGKFGSGIEIKPQGIGEHSFNGLGHAPILRFASPPNKRLQPADHWRMMARG